METTNPWSWGRRSAVGAILVAGALSVWWTVNNVMGETQPPAAPPEKFMETFKSADEIDRANWDRMWKDAGKKPPPR
ncbi:hypothetical protein VT84_00850 [Gemmata sp. SH-PL17]|uniref:hypothetical protein n=1 Tax=Gemmata sp. SH-PL17 TaxID=1630693 RepID=UPI0004B77917|nr:hypothetical protein [Gemmata sp. SH-PL17]AMV22926.1 hypothetical protein VT84_00850 [Gemmata sp. SH-PL17]